MHPPVIWVHVVAVCTSHAALPTLTAPTNIGRFLYSTAYLCASPRGNTGPRIDFPVSEDDLQ